MKQKESRVSPKSPSSLALSAGIAAIPQPLPAEEQLALLFRLTELPPQLESDEYSLHSPQGIAEAYRHCEQMIRQHSKSFFFSTWFLPVEKRKAVHAFYAFCRVTDDTVDYATGDPARTLAAWVQQARATHPVSDNPVLLAWHDTRTRYNLSPTLVDELLAGMAMDLSIHRYATFADLWLYCYRVASVVGLLSMGVTGAAPGATPYAIKLGVALQMTNILRDVGEDAKRGRVYLPQEDLERFDLTAEEILRGVYDERFRNLMRFEVDRTYRLYAESWPGIGLLPPDSRLAVAAAARIYAGILDKLVANDYDSHTKRAFLTLREKLVRLPQLWFDMQKF